MGFNKLTLPMDGRNVLGSMINRCITAGFAEIVVVGGFELAQQWPQIVGEPILATYNPDFRSALSFSIRTGVRATSTPSCGYAVILADLLALSPATMRLLNSEFTKRLQQDSACIIRPSYSQQFGHPVYFSSMYRSSLVSLDEMSTQQTLIANFKQHFRYIPVSDPGVIMDIDTPEDLKKFPEVL